eukprot:3912884-Amphidinium_carterae.1
MARPMEPSTLTQSTKTALEHIEWVCRNYSIYSTLMNTLQKRTHLAIAYVVPTSASSTSTSSSVVRGRW